MGFSFPVALMLAISLFLPSRQSSSQEISSPSEYELKAAFLYNFALYTEWPVAPVEAFDFCVLGKDPFGARLDQIRHKILQGKPIKIRRLGTVSEVKGCHLLFVPAIEKEQYSRLASALSQQAILTVTDAPQMDDKWPVIMINLVLEGERYTFDINQSAAKTAGLTFSSKLLRLARSIR
jgi:hypothetical protein